MSIECKTARQLEKEVRSILNDYSFDYLKTKEHITEMKESFCWNFHLMRCKLLVREQRIYELLPRWILYFMRKRCQYVTDDIDCYNRVFLVVGK